MLGRKSLTLKFRGIKVNLFNAKKITIIILSQFKNFNSKLNARDEPFYQFPLIVIMNYISLLSPFTTTSRMGSVGAFCPVHSSNCPTA